MSKNILKLSIQVVMALFIVSCGLGGSSGKSSGGTVDVKTPDIPGAKFETVGVVNVGDTVSLESFEYTTLDYDNQNQVSLNTFYYYQFTATSEYTSITALENNSMDFEPGHKVQSCIFDVYDSNGVIVESAGNGTDTGVYKTTSGQKYGILVVPTITIYDGVSYKSDIIKFVITEYVGLNKTVSDASEITVGKSYSGFFTNNSRENFYKINLSAGSYVFEAYNILDIELTDASGNDVFPFIYNSADKKFVISSTGIYNLKITGYPYYPVDDYSIFITDLSTLSTITPSGSWLDQNLSVFKSNYYKVPVDSTKDYLVSWKDKEEGGVGVNSACIEVSLLTDNSLHLIPLFGETVLDEEAKGFIYPHIVNFLPGTSEAILKINSRYTFSPGSYSVLFKENDTVINYEIVNLGVETVADVSDGDVRYYKFIIDHSKQYTFTFKQGDNASYTGWASLDLFTADKRDFFIRNSVDFDMRIVFSDTSSSNTELILKVNHSDHSPGTVGFMLEEVVPVP